MIFKSGIPLKNELPTKTRDDYFCCQNNDEKYRIDIDMVKVLSPTMLQQLLFPK